VLRLILCALCVAGCTSFVDVRSAEVFPGPQLDVGVTAATPPGDGPAWFWGFDCATECNHWIFGPHVSLRYGRVPDAGGRPYELGAGFSGTYPYVTGYVQLRRAPRPFGIGGRIGIPFGSWREDALFARYDLSGGANRVVFTPTLFLHSGSSPSGRIAGWFLAFAPALGVQINAGTDVPVTVSLTPVVGRSSRGRSTFTGQEVWESATAVFLVAGLSLTFQRGR
jgi:hypothetical protein